MKCALVHPSGPGAPSDLDFDTSRISSVVTGAIKLLMGGAGATFLTLGGDNREKRSGNKTLHSSGNSSLSVKLSPFRILFNVLLLSFFKQLLCAPECNPTFLFVTICLFVLFIHLLGLSICRCVFTCFIRE